MNVRFIHKLFAHLKHNTLWFILIDRFFRFFRRKNKTLQKTFIGRKIFYKFKSFYFGSSAPKYAQRIWINPQKCQVVSNKYTKMHFNPKNTSGRVIKFWPDQSMVYPPYSHEIIHNCVKHWVRGMTWEETGEKDRMIRELQSRHKYSLPQSIVKRKVNNRCNKLDDIYNFVKKQGYLTRAQLVPDNFREEGNFFVHIGPNGECLFAGGGYHRFAMCLILKLELVPAQVGWVHKKAIKNNIYSAFSQY